MKMRLALLATLVGLVSFAAPRSASACGGFFCSGQQIDQSGERVLYVLEDGHVQAHIQIQFQGDAADFSWVVPVQSVPTVSAGSDDLFNALLATTVPQFSRDDQTDKSCRDLWDEEADLAGGDGGGDGDADSDADADRDGDVTVVASGVAGPFDYQVIDSDDPDALQDWLTENGYDVPDNSLPIIASYLDSGMFFLGLQLTKGSDAGDLRPVVLDMDQDEACLPIRLTAIAATADMPILVWVLADEQAVSTNYAEVWLNDLHLYMQQSPDYSAIVNGALDEAGGRAFLVDFAGAPDMARDALRPDRYDVDRLRGLTDARDFVRELQAQGILQSPLATSLMAEHLPVPKALVAEGVTQEMFQQCITCDGGCSGDYYYDYDCYSPCERCYGDELESLGYTFDTNAFADAVDASIAEPLRRAAEPFSRLTKLTRLYTTMSPAEMTEDPIFMTNADLPDVANVRNGVRTLRCHTGSPYYDTTTPNGLRACYPDEWDFTPEDLPFALLAIQQSENGAGTLVVDNRSEIQTRYPCAGRPDSPAIYVPGGRFAGSPTDPWSVNRTGGNGGLCSVSGTAPSAAPIAIALAALAVVWRRKR